MVRSKCEPVQAIGKNAMFTAEGVKVYACREVEKVSSKGKRQARTLLLFRQKLCLMDGKRVRRLVAYTDIARAETQQQDSGIFLRLAMESTSGEPDLLFHQTAIMEKGAAASTDARDIVRLICELSGRNLAVIDRNGAAPLTEKNCSLRKPANYSPRLRFEEQKEERRLSEKESVQPDGEVQLTEIGADEEDTTGTGLDTVDREAAQKTPPPPPPPFSQNLRNSSTMPHSSYHPQPQPHQVSQHQQQQRRSHPFNKCLCIAIGYLGTQHELPRAGHDARMVVKAFEGLGFFKSAGSSGGSALHQDNFLLLSDCDSGAGTPAVSPTRANIISALDWLVSGCIEGDSLLLVYVGHCRQSPAQHAAGNSLRDGPNEVMYPLDFDPSTHPSGGVITEPQFGSHLYPALTHGVNLTVVCDACAGGCLLNLPYKLKVSIEGGLKATMEQSEQQCAGKIVQISGYRDLSVAAATSVATGGIAAGLCSALAGMKRAGQVGDKVEYNTTFEDVLTGMRHVVLSTQGAGGQLPQVAATPQGNSQDLFFSLFLKEDAGPFGSPMAAQWGGQEGRGEEGGSAGPSPYANSLKPLPPPTLRTALPPSILESKGLVDLLEVRSTAAGATPEIYFASEVISVEVRPVDPAANPAESSPVVLWPTAKVVLVGRDAIYLLDPNGDVDRCIPIQDISDYILIKSGVPIEQVMTPQPVAGSVAAVGTSRHHWLAVRVPSKYELLFQPVEKEDGLSPQTNIQQFLHVVNELMQHGNNALLGSGEPAKVLVIDRNGPITPGLLRLLRPRQYSFPFVPLHVTFFPDQQDPHRTRWAGAQAHNASQSGSQYAHYSPSRLPTIAV